MSFREKSAWAMAAVMLVTGLFYLRMMQALPADGPASTQIGPMIPYVIALIILSVAVQVVLAVVAPKDASRPADERERAAIDRAGHWSGLILATGMISGIGSYLVWNNGNILMLWAMGALIISQIAEYALQIYLFRKGV